MLKGHLPRVIYHEVYQYTKIVKLNTLRDEIEQVMIGIVNARLAEKDCVEKGTLGPQPSDPKSLQGYLPYKKTHSPRTLT